MNNSPLIGEDQKKWGLRNITLYAVVGVFISFIIAAIIVYAADRPKDNSINFIYVNDIHIDPTYVETSLASEGNECRIKSEQSTVKRPYGQYGCDTPIKTFESMINFIPNAEPKPEFILFGGDTLAHGLKPTKEDIAGNLTYIMNKFQEKYPNVPFLMTLGNNDFERNYGEFDTDAADFANIANVLDRFMTPEQVQTFKKGGYYAHDIKSQKLRLLLLNTVMYCGKRTTAPDDPEDPYGQLAWIKQQYEEARSLGYSVGAALHIPPGVVYTDYIQGFKDVYLEAFNNAVANLSINFYIVGHVHKDMFLPVYPGASPTFQIVAPAVSASHDNNPGFRVMTLDHGTISNYRQYIADIRPNPQDGPNATGLLWELSYDFRSLYAQPDVSLSSLAKTVNHINQSRDAYWAYFRNMAAQAGADNSFFLCILYWGTADAAHKCTAGLNTKLIMPYGRYGD